MIAPLRAWHRRWWLLLAVALPILILLALSARQTVPPTDQLPAGALSAGDRP